MEIVKKFEDLVASWLKPLPRWPQVIQRQLAGRLWWMAVFIATACVVGAFGSLWGLLESLAALDNASAAESVRIARVVLDSGASLLTGVAVSLMLILAVRPLRQMQKSGWYFMFAALCLHAASVVVGAFFAFSALGFMVKLLFGSIGVTLLAYLLFQTQNQFMHTERSKGSRRIK